MARSASPLSWAHELRVWAHELKILVMAQTLSLVRSWYHKPSFPTIYRTTYMTLHLRKAVIKMAIIANRLTIPTKMATASSATVVLWEDVSNSPHSDLQKARCTIAESYIYIQPAIASTPHVQYYIRILLVEASRIYVFYYVYVLWYKSNRPHLLVGYVPRYPTCMCTCCNGVQATSMGSTHGA